MEIIPSIDVLNGQAVKFSRSLGKAEIVHGEAIDIVPKWRNEGAEWLHIVDLDGALQTGAPRDALVAILQRAHQLGVSAQLGGGLRSDEAVEFHFGEAARREGRPIERAIVATRAVRDPAWLDRAAHRFPRRFILALDCVDDEMAIDGWRTRSGVRLPEFLKQVHSLPLWGYLYTNLRVEGKGEGVDWSCIDRMLELADKPVLFSGGVSSLEDVAGFKARRAYGIILGSALYANRIPLAEAFEIGKETDA